MRQTRRLSACLCLILGLLLSAPGMLPAASPANIMSQAMLSMMDAMGDLAHRYKGSGNWSLGSGLSPYSSLSGFSGYPLNLYSMPGSPLSGGMPMQSPIPGTGYPAMPGLPQTGSLPQLTPPLSPVDGIWLGRGGEIVLVMYGHFRIYASAEVYQDGRFEIHGNRLIMQDLQSDRRMIFQYYLEDGRMILRNAAGDLLLFKQLPIPIPPYTLMGSPGETGEAVP